MVVHLLNNEKLYNYTKPEKQFIDIYNYIKNNKINLSPDYQRGFVWSDEKKSYLIESSIKQYYIPPLILNLNNDGIYMCIDGKQRIKSIVDFIDDNIYIELDGENIYYSDLSKLDQEIFNSKTIMVCLYENLNYSDEVEIFRRVQNGESMTAVELMRSHNPELISHIRKETHQYDALLCVCNVKIKRDNTISYFIRLLMLEENNKKDFITLTHSQINIFLKKYTKNNYKKLSDTLVRYWKNINIFIDFIKNHINKSFALLHAIILYKLIMNNKLNSNIENYLNFYKSDSHIGITAYTPNNLQKVYDSLNIL